MCPAVNTRLEGRHADPAVAGEKTFLLARTLRETVAGGVTINDTILHIAQENLPFGGVGASGMGHYHGHDGFMTFSKRKGVFRQSRLNAMGWFKPHYGARFRRLVDLLIR